MIFCGKDYNMELGKVHLYTGDGKGKTTAALGLAMRAVGNGIPVLVVQFQKGSSTGELIALEKLEIPVLRNHKDYGFIKNMTQKDRENVTLENNENLLAALEWIKGKNCMLILDELMSVYNNGLIDIEMVQKMLDEPMDNVELVMTGRNADNVFVEKSDYLTEMCCRKHPYAKGVGARKGIEF